MSVHGCVGVQAVYEHWGVSILELCGEVHLLACLDAIMRVFVYMSEHLHVSVCVFPPPRFISRTSCFVSVLVPASDGLLNV